MDVASFIAIDGPVGSGKTTVGRLLAARLGHTFLDTGVMYRAVTYLALQKNVSLNDAPALTKLASTTEMELVPASGEECRVIVDSGDLTDRLRSPEVDRAVSAVSAVPGVREVLVRLQREVAIRGQIVMVGRDIGTVVLPGADLKIYLVACPEERARRRYLETLQRDEPTNYDQVLADLKRRDKLDSERALAPLQPASDAAIVDTDGLDVAEVLNKVVSLIEEKQ